MATRWVPNRAFQQEFERTPQFDGTMAARTVLVARFIEQAAAPFRDTGAYIGAIDTRGNLILFERHTAHLQEYGSVNNPPQANARRGVAAAGLRFEDSRAVLV